jgi:3-methyladenine DNA glycosylase Mpg
MCDSEGDFFIEEAGQIPENTVTTGARVGLNNVPEPWKSVPWRFLVLPGSFNRQEGFEE